MYVCCCMAVTEDEVGGAIAAGCHSREAVTLACRAGGDCGACHGMIETMIDDHLEATRPAPDATQAPPETADESGPQLVSAESLVRVRAA
jgi:bacterioferritin-associated ferredoxin